MFVNPFFEYFDWLLTRSTATNRSRQARIRNTRVGRSIIGQQPALSSNENQLLDTVAPTNRARESGAIGSVTLEAMDVSESADSSTDQDRSLVGTPRRRTAPSDGRSAPPDGPFIGRRRLNVEFGGLSPAASLPPSASRLGSVNLDRMERRYNAIAESLSHLGRQHRIRPVNAITNNIINAYEKLNELEKN